ncbi:hypothetical protein CCYA_CCYA01G0391 [Cyanidiococcus yangmingshanensis]|nr:hypothetical protein CCYA_CCYA01G0391 [Cyanidiococcus yangmingshanensis]
MREREQRHQSEHSVFRSTGKLFLYCDFTLVKNWHLMGDTGVSLPSASDISGKKRMVSRQVGQDCIALLELKRLDFEYPGRRFLSRVRKQVDKKRYLAVTKSRKLEPSEAKTRSPLSLHKLSGTSLQLTRSWSARDLRGITETGGPTEAEPGFTLLFKDGSFMVCVPVKTEERDSFLHLLRTCYREVFSATLPIESVQQHLEEAEKPAKPRLAEDERLRSRPTALSDTRAALEPDTQAIAPFEGDNTSQQTTRTEDTSSNYLPESLVQDELIKSTQILTISGNGALACSRASAPGLDTAESDPSNMRTMAALDLGLVGNPDSEGIWKVLDPCWSQWTSVTHGPEQLHAFCESIEKQALSLAAEQSHWQRLVAELRNQPWMQNEEWKRLLSLQQEIINLRKLEHELRYALDLCTLTAAELEMIDGQQRDAAHPDEMVWNLAEKLLEWVKFAAEHPSWRVVMESTPMHRRAMTRVIAVMKERLALQVERLVRTIGSSEPPPNTSQDTQRNQWLRGYRLLALLASDAKAQLFDDCINLLAESPSLRAVTSDLQIWMTKTAEVASDRCLEPKHVEQFVSLLEAMHRVVRDQAIQLAPLLVDATPLIMEGALHQAFGTPLFSWLHGFSGHGVLIWLVVLLALESVLTGASSRLDWQPQNQSFLSSDPTASSRVAPGNTENDNATPNVPAEASADERSRAESMVSATWESWLRQCLERVRAEWRRILQQEATRTASPRGASASNGSSFLEAVAQLAGGTETPFAHRSRQEWEYYRQSPAFASWRCENATERRNDSRSSPQNNGLL